MCLATWDAENTANKNMDLALCLCVEAYVICVLGNKFLREKVNGGKTTLCRPVSIKLKESVPVHKCKNILRPKGVDSVCVGCWVKRSGTWYQDQTHDWHNQINGLSTDQFVGSTGWRHEPQAWTEDTTATDKATTHNEVMTVQVGGPYQNCQSQSQISSDGNGTDRV